MEKFTVASRRKALETARALASSGVMFIPVPVFTEEAAAEAQALAEKNIQIFEAENPDKVEGGSCQR